MATVKRASTGAGEILTLDEVAAYLKVGKRTVYRLTAAKKIPAFKIGGAWRFSRADIDSWIKRQSLNGPGDGPSTPGSIGDRPSERRQK